MEGNGETDIVVFLQVERVEPADPRRQWYDVRFEYDVRLLYIVRLSRVGAHDMSSPQNQRSKREFTSIWLQPERTPRGSQASLSRGQIVRAAIAIADAEGFEAVTMRRLAAELGVGTMSLYWHVPNKDNLLELMRDELIGEVEMPDPPSGDWRADLRTNAL